MGMGMSVVVMVMAFLVADRLRGEVTVGSMVGMPVKRPLEEKHQKETGQHPGGCRVDVVAKLIEGMRQQVQKPHAQHHSGRERQQHLHPPVTEREERHRASAGKRRPRNQQQVDAEADRGQHVRHESRVGSHHTS